MAISRIVVQYLKDKITGKATDVKNLIFKQPDGIARTINDEDIKVNNSTLLDGKTLAEVRDGGNAATIGGYNPEDLLAQDRYEKIRLLSNTDGLMFPHQYKVGVTHEEEIIFWGYNYGGYFIYGLGSSLSNPNTINNPKRGISKIKDIYASAWDLFVLYEDGDLYGMGQNTSGSLGLGNTAVQYKLELLLKDVKMISTCTGGGNVNYHTTLALKNDRSLWGTGRNPVGQLGNNTTTSLTSWTAIAVTLEDVGDAIEEVYVVGTENTSTYLRTVMGKIYSTGYNAYGQLGLGHTTQVTQFTKIATLDPHNIVEIKSFSGVGTTYRHSVICRSDAGNIFVWGANAQGELGLGHTTQINSPTELTNLPLPYNFTNNPIVEIISSKSEFGSFLLLTQDGDLFAAGYNGYGQLGDGTTGNKTNWVHVATNIDKVYSMTGTNSSASHTRYALTKDKKLLAWGSNSQGQCGQNNSTPSILVPTEVLFEHSDKIVQVTVGGSGSGTSASFLLSDGRVFSVGNNDFCEVNAKGQTSAYVSRLIRSI